jgi:misacylated tRNA(Ala) deacylase
MSELFQQDSYLRTCTSQVVRHDDAGLVLDDTIFYPIGGGQPGDTGTIVLEDGSRIPVLDTRRHRETREILHLLPSDAPRLAPGTAVTLELDWERRHRHMRMHTCLHLLGSLIKAGVTGGNLTDRGGRLDFDTADALDAQTLTAALQQLVAADLPLHVSHISGEELAARPELIRTMSVTPPMHLPQIRLVEVDGIDLQPCGGTHVARTGEVGAVCVSKIESKGSHNRRVVLAFTD